MTKKIRSKRSSSTRRGKEDVLKIRRFVRISHHKHTGKHLPLRFTSYSALFFILIMVGLSLFFARQSLVEAGPPQVQSGNVQLTGVVPGPPPSSPANITSPANNQHVTEAAIDIQGDCTAGLIIEIWRNNATSGSAICDPGGKFNIQITLLPGENKLRARTSDALGQYGPDSPVVIVFYDVPSAEAILNEADAHDHLTLEQATRIHNILSNKPLLLFSKSVHTGYYVGGKAKLPYEINGGQPAYAVSVDWDDRSKNTLASYGKAGDYAASHKYKKAGQFQAVITGTDQLGTQTTFQTILVVNGDREAVEGATNNHCQTNTSFPDCPLNSQLVEQINRALPPVIGATFMAASFWLGERVVFFRLARDVKAKRT